AAEHPGRLDLRSHRRDALLPPPLAPRHRAQLAEPSPTRHGVLRRGAPGRTPVTACGAPARARGARGRFGARPVLGSVVPPDAARPRRGNYPRMLYTEHRDEELPVAFETATVRDAMSNGVISCPPETPLRVVARMMATFGVHAIFVFEYVEEDDE